MKKILVAILFMATFLLAAACGQQTSPTPGFSKSDVYLIVDENQYKCKDNIRTVIERLGYDYDYSDGLSCAYEGLDKTYTYELATFYTNPLPDGDLVSEIYTESPEATTSKGIAVGAKKEEVLAAYGDGGDDVGNMLIYRTDAQGKKNPGSLCFEIQDDEVIAIFITTEPV